MIPSSDPSGPPARPAKLRVLRRVLIALAAIVALPLALAALLQTPWGVRLATQVTLDVMRPARNMRMVVTGARGGFLTGIELHDITLTSPDGSVRVRFDTLRVTYRPLELMRHPVRMRAVSLDGLAIYARVTEDSLRAWLRPRTSKSPPLAIDCDRITLKRGSLDVAMVARTAAADSSLPSWRAARVDAWLHDLRLRGAESTLALDSLLANWTAADSAGTSGTLAARARLEPGRIRDLELRIDDAQSHLALDGSFAIPGASDSTSADTDLRLRLSPLAGADLRRLFPKLSRAPDVTMDAGVTGAMRSLSFRAAVRAGSGGRLDADGRAVVSWTSRSSILVHARASGLDAAEWSDLPPGATVAGGSLDADLRGADLAHLNGPMELAMVAGRAGDAEPAARANLSARFSDGLASLRADAVAGVFTFACTGRARPWGARSECDLAIQATVPPTRLPRRPPAPPAPVLAAGTVRGTLRAARSDSGGTEAEARFEYLPDARVHALMGPGRIEGSLARDLLTWTLEASVGGGEISARGDWAGGAVARFSIPHAELRALPLGELLGDSLATELDATLSLSGSGAPLSKARIRGRVSPLVLRRAGRVAHADSAEFTLYDGRLDWGMRGDVDGAAVAGRGWIVPPLPPWREAGLDLEFHGLDAAQLAGDSVWTSKLSGRIAGWVRAPDLGAWVSSRELREEQARQAEGELHVALEPSEWRHGQVATLSFDASILAGQLEYSGTLESSFGRARLDGEARPFGPAREAHVRTLTFENLDLAGLIGSGLPHTRLGGRLNADGSGANLDSLNANWIASLDSSTVSDVPIDRVRLVGHVDRGALEARLEAAEGPDSLLARLAGRFGLGTRGRDFSASGRFEGGVRLGSARFDTMRCDFSYRDGVLRLPRLEIAGRVLAVSASGQVAFANSEPGESTQLRVLGSVRDLSPLGERLDVVPLEAGTGKFEFSAVGPVDNVTLTGELVATHVRAGLMRTDSVHVALDGTANGDSLTRLDARLLVHGLVPGSLLERDVAARLQWNRDELGLEARTDMSDGGTQELAFRFRPSPTEPIFYLDQLDLHQRGTHVVLDHPAVVRMGRTLAVDDLVLLQDGHRCVLVSGAVGDGESSTLSVAIDSLDLAPPFSWLGLPGAHGRITASATLTGTRREPEVKGSVRGTLATSRGRPARLEGTMAWLPGTLRGALRFSQNERQHVALEVRLPLRLNLDPHFGETVMSFWEDSLVGAIESKQLDLAWFEPLISPRIMRKVKGRLDGSAGVSGTPLHPRLAGALEMSRARILVPPLGTGFEADRLRLGFEERNITLEPAVVKSGNGRLEISAALRLEDARRRTFDARAKLDEFRLMNTALARVEMSGELVAGGTPERVRLTGTLQTANSTLYLEGGQADRSLEKVELTEPDWRELEARFSDTDAAVPLKFPNPVDSLSADVIVKVGRNVWIRRRSDPIVALELGGEVRAVREPGAFPQLAGRLDVRTGRSYLSFLNRRFEMTRARVELPGPIREASAELEAQYLPSSSGSANAAGPDVTALVTLDSEGARVDLRSTPFMEHSALINYLATGQTQGEMSSGTAYGMAVGSVLGTLGGSAGRSLGLDVVQVTQDAYGGQTLSAGNQVKPQLYLGFRQPVVQGQQSSSRGENSSYTTEFEVELEAGRRMLLNLQGGGSQYRFLLRPRLGK